MFLIEKLTMLLETSLNMIKSYKLGVNIIAKIETSV